MAEGGRAETELGVQALFNLLQNGDGLPPPVSCRADQFCRMVLPQPPDDAEQLPINGKVQLNLHLRGPVGPQFIHLVVPVSDEGLAVESKENSLKKR